MNANSDNNSNSKAVDEELDKELDETIRAAALRWASERGGRSGRVAYQFSRYWIGQSQLAAADSQS